MTESQATELIALVQTISTALEFVRHLLHWIAGITAALVFAVAWGNR